MPSTTFQLPGDGCWTLRVVVTGPGGTVTLPDAIRRVNNSLFPDQSPPTITVPANITTVATSSAGASVNFGAVIADDQPGSTLVCIPATGSTFPVGITTVTCAGRDATGNGAETKTFTVTVTVPAPTITVPATFSVPASGVTTPVSFTATAYSIVDHELTVTCRLVLDPARPPLTSSPDGTAYGQFNSAFPPLATVVACEAWDQHGQLVSASFVVTVALDPPSLRPVVTYDSGPTPAVGTPYVFGTWTGQNVRVRWICLPGTANTFCSPDTILMQTGADQTVTGTTTDAAGRSATMSIGNIDIDQTAPSVTRRPP